MQHNRKQLIRFVGAGLPRPYFHRSPFRLHPSYKGTLMEITSLFKKEIVSNGGKLMTKQRRFAYTSLTPILLYMGLFTLFPIVWAV
jgi:hypothetical protein